MQTTTPSERVVVLTTVLLAVAAIPTWMRPLVPGVRAAEMRPLAMAVLAQPNDTPTPPTPTPTPTPTITNSVQLSIIGFDGPTCRSYGGVRMLAEFDARAMPAPVAEMRLFYPTWDYCPVAESLLGDLPWEPFEPRREFSIQAGPHWIEFALAAQYRDERGNVSRVVCDSISQLCQGSPTPSPSPTPRDTATPEWPSRLKLYLPMTMRAGP